MPASAGLSRCLLVERHDELDSTNTRAAQLAADPETPLPALVVADRQTAGRGRGANRWWSSGGALTCSLLIDASEGSLPAARWPLVSLATAVTMGELLADYLPYAPVALKWPNDVYVGPRKICGILVETPPVRPARLIVGIGLNVNNSLADAPDDLRAKATSLRDEHAAPFDREEVLDRLLARLLATLPEVARGAFPLVERWAPRCLLYGKQLTLATPGGPLSGHCAGIAPSGALRLLTSHGEQHLFAGTVEQWR